MSANNKLSQIFGIPVTDTNQELLPVQKTSENHIEQALQDFEKVRENVTNSITLGQMALSDLALLAAASQDDKMYTAFAKLMMAVTMANKTLIDIHDKKLGIVPKDQQNENTTINNNLYLTTAEFIELQGLKEKTKKTDND